MPASPLKIAGWRTLTSGYHDRPAIEAILRICQFGALIGHEGQRHSSRIFQKLTSALECPEIVTTGIKAELEKGRLVCYQNDSVLPDNFTTSPLGLIDKSDRSKRRIHHLSYLQDETTSINNGIPGDYGTISYSTIREATAAIQTFGSSCLLVKRDFENAFCHILISLIDVPLLGFEWKRKYYAEQFLPFGLRTVPYLCNLFAEVYYWILADVLRQNAIPAEIIHYLDDFLIILPCQGNYDSYSRIFSELSTRVGLSIKESKSEQGTVASFGGVEFDTAQMVVHLPIAKLNKAWNLVATAISQNSFSLLELQTLTGYLNFVSIVALLGRTFLRRLYNMQLYFLVGKSRHRRLISGQGMLDLRCWLDALERKPER